MFDIGWPELLVIAVLTIIVVGPKELPRVLRTVTGIIRKIRMVAGDFQNSIEDIAREADMEDIKKELEKAGSRDYSKEMEDYLDPTGDMSKSVKELEGDMNSWKEKAQPAPSNSITPPVGDGAAQGADANTTPEPNGDQKQAKTS
ncbi:Sec-independent protein translocase protein TatB [Aestuariispira insulae]|uniref:Sec-independent protein translocase protein TatB n=1 Tax=Aestuariispira insulae TaxID=1461337 RepID=A0A3D9HNI4_9PROT|nr:Sec-independent protein translocase protein TatB [Aestuariispira insulae]RED51038.1 sec-independent protein translocase protein TatB [Aestuariispira insulae]